MASARTTPTVPVTEEHPPGASLHLGGRAWAHPSLEPLLVPIDSLTPYPGNPRRGDQKAITDSIRDHGLYAGVVAQQATGHILVGNHRRHALIQLGATRIPVTPVAVDDVRAAAIVLRDNHTSDLGRNDEDDLLALLVTLQAADALSLTGFADEDISALLDADALPEKYTRRLDPVQYVPTAEQAPPPHSLVDRTKTNDLIVRALDADLPAEVRDFLIAGAQRHLVFDYAAIAEFYAHASPEVQSLMEASALVIVDFEDAIRLGYVRLSTRLATLLGDDLAVRAELDADA